MYEDNSRYSLIAYRGSKEISHKYRTTVKALVEEGLRRLINEHQQRGNFRLRKATVKGEGLQADMQGISWDGIRERAYEDRGG